jgi:hypothetical protein
MTGAVKEEVSRVRAKSGAVVEGGGPHATAPTTNDEPTETQNM